jgi:RNA polymerase sigma-70 factor (ECF subfamily)
MSVSASEADRAEPPAPARTLDPALLGNHVDRLYRAAWALTGHRQDAEDLVQETFARVLARPRFVRRDDDLAYLLTVLRNTFFSLQRARRRRPATVALPDEPVFEERRTSGRPEAMVEAGLVYAAVAALPESYRDVVVAVDVAGLSYDEAARSLGIPRGTVMSRLHRGRAQVVRAVDGG